jgi:hypothetical protein
MVNNLVVNLHYAKLVEWLTESDTLADLRLRLDFKAKEVQATIFNSVVANGIVRLKDNTVWLDIYDNLFMKRHAGAYSDANYVAYVFSSLLDTVKRWTLMFSDHMPTLRWLASPSAQGESRFLPPAPEFVSAKAPITGTIVGDFFALLDSWAKSSGVTFVEFEIHRETRSLTARWDKYTIYITPFNAMVVDSAGNALAVADPDGYYSVVVHLDNLTQFGYALDAVFNVYKPITLPDRQVGPTVFEYVLSPNAMFNIVFLKFRR